MLAGRKLLLADDSITIQKVVDLTFADEGVSVVCVNNGREAIERVEEFMPDVVLVDVFMPQVNGYEVCEYIKQHENLKHIPVMLLVGSFEPFDEEAARRVGANDTLTKPFQSIRRLIDKVGQMVSNRPPEEQIPTAELPKQDETPEPVERLSTDELEMSTADTQPLPAELKHVVEAAAASAAAQPETQTKLEETMESSTVNETSPGAANYEGGGEVLLDLGDYSRERSALDEDFVLDVDLEETPEPSPAEPAFSGSAFRSRPSFTAPVPSRPLNGGSYAMPSAAMPPAVVDQFANTQEWDRGASTAEIEAPVAIAAEEPTPMATSGAPQLSQEMIDTIARRAVEQLSEKVIQEIAWEVVPQLAELLIKRQLEEKNS